MNNGKPLSDAFVFFGATGDLAYKKIFPALQALVRRGKLTVPVVGLGRSIPPAGCPDQPRLPRPGEDPEGDLAGVRDARLASRRARFR